jgi:ectoine hydroxylase-related dioxygenase (phytanoyl-CoA dioxygenase family)
MSDAVYGISVRAQIDDDLAGHAEEIEIQGYTVLHGLFPDAGLPRWRKKIDDVYEQQEKDFGRENLIAIGDADICRAPLLRDFDFVEMASHPRILALARHILGDWIILNLQNANINKPGQPHHQTAWHRDLPYQNFVISRPLSLSALVAIDEFSTKTGATEVLPFSHKTELMPSPEYTRSHACAIEAPAGSVIVFDSMLFHRAGINRSGQPRRAVNHLYTAPILKQQYDFPRALGDRPDLDSGLTQLLGYTSQVPLDDRDWRRGRARRNHGVR